MSIEDELEKLVHRGKLIERPSSFLWEPGRSMYLPPDIVAMARRPFADTMDGMRLAELAQFLDAFSEVNAITVWQDPTNKPRDVMLARVAPKEDDFWSMRITDPENSPGIRLLGAFCAKDSFVGLKCEFRESMNFDDDVKDVRITWQNYFGSVRPFSGSTLDDYLTNYLEQ